MHICVGNLTVIGSDSGLALTRRRYLNKCWNIVNVTLGNKLQGNSIEILTVSFKKMWLKGSSAKWRPFCIGFNVPTTESSLITWLS